MNLTRGDTRAIITACAAAGLLRTQCAYVLATTHGEVGPPMKPIHEKGKRAYFNKYDPEFNPRKAKELGNTRPGDGYLFRGRGYPQVTGRSNYAKASAVVGVDLIANPDRMLESAIAIPVMIDAMVKGWFTGKKLSNYITAKKTDYVGARRIINGQDRAEEFAGYAQQYDALLEADGYKPARVKKTPAAPAPEASVDIYDGKVHEIVRAVQTHLDRIGYPEVGTLDGRWGSRTRNMVLAYRADNNLPMKPEIDDELIVSLTAAPDKSRVISVARKETTVSDLREEGAEEITSADTTQVAGGIAGAGGVIAAAKPVLDQAEEYGGIVKQITAWVEPVQQFVSDNLWLIVIGAGAFIAYQAWQMKKLRVEKHQTGQDVSR